MSKNHQNKTFSAGLFLVAWSAGALALSVHAIAKGGFLWGGRHHHHSTPVQPETHPYFYWGWLTLWTCAAMWIGWMGVRKLWASRRQKKGKD